MPDYAVLSLTMYKNKFTKILLLSISFRHFKILFLRIIPVKLNKWVSRDVLESLQNSGCWLGVVERNYHKKISAKNLFSPSFFASLKISPDEDFASGFLISAHG